MSKRKELWINRGAKELNSMMDADVIDISEDEDDEVTLQTY